MHISEGIVSAPVLTGGAVLTAVGTAVGLKKLDYERIMTSAILTAAFFVGSLVHIPVGPANVHLILNGLIGVILGWASFPAILTGLFMQAVFFQYGGIVVLGVNTFNMAAPAVCSYYCLRPWLDNSRGKQAVAAWLGGFFSVFLAAVFLALSLTLTDEGFLETAGILIGAHLPVMIIEGFVTMFAVVFLNRVQPEILKRSKMSVQEKVSRSMTE
ncbi:MAG: cobalt transporter CbiM [Thermodesulfobacteriota bacterium]